MRGQSYIILSVVFAVVIAIFAVINVDPVEVNYLFGSGEAPLILVILFSVLMGAVITATVGVFRLIQLQREIRRLKQESQTRTEIYEEPDVLVDNRSDHYNSNELLKNAEDKK
ncbi:lipopolysaccharide assembly protein LapA domain-containing protein [Gracilibacillus sp. YIM 98692]|uniref:LapA family protein n=1 Tax=Gracilibacillus sp. YIM 98692 TaxID=2663532 RepID=UPI0013D809D6|nr:lipopolysaccharide assembly protein LapA domain-containing protein [Gracilibacillus sp. YIM 98692]